MSPSLSDVVDLSDAGIFGDRVDAPTIVSECCNCPFWSIRRGDYMASQKALGGLGVMTNNFAIAGGIDVLELHSNHGHTDDFG